MNMIDCQNEMRTTFKGGVAGQLVSGVIWLLSSVISDIFQPGYGMAFLFFGSMFIFPLTQALLLAMRSPVKVSAGNKLWDLGAQTAFTVPVNFLLVAAATLHRQDWFFPAAMIVVGAHYFPFVTLYGMKFFTILGGILAAFGAYLALFTTGYFSIGGWITGSILILAAFVGWKIAARPKGNDGVL